MLGVLVLLPRKFLDFWHILPRSWHYSWQGSQDFANFFRIVERNPTKFIGHLGKKTKNIQDLGKRIKKTWIFCRDNSWIFEISCQDLGNYSWQGSQDFARFFKIVERNPRKITEFFSTKPRKLKILARETRKSCIKFLQKLNFKTLYLQWRMNFSRGTHVR